MAVWWMLLWLLAGLLLLLAARWLWQLYFLSHCDPASHLPLPPGDMGWPLVGEMIDFIYQLLTGGDFFQMRRKKYGAVFKTHIFGKPTVRVVGCDNLKPILLGEHTHVQSQWPRSLCTLVGTKYNLARATGDEHKLRRRRVYQAFSKSALEGYTEPLQHIVVEELERWCTIGNILVYKEAIRITQRAALEVLIGFTDVTPVERATFAEHVETFITGFLSSDWPIPGSAYAKALKSRSYLIDLLRKQLSKNQEGLHFRSALNLIQDTQQDAGHMAEEEEVLEIMLELLYAGHSLLRSTITSTVMQLGRHPEVVKKVKDELDQHAVFLDKRSSLTLDKLNQLTYVNRVVKEVLRTQPPCGGGFRTVLHTLEIEGYQIPKGWSVVYSIKDSHDTSPEFSKPSSFYPERWAALESRDNLPPCLFLTFGAGTRACPGKEYSKLALRILVVVLVRMCNWKLDSEVTVLKRFPSVQPVDGLPAIFSQISQQLTGDTTEYETRKSDENHIRQRRADA